MNIVRFLPIFDLVPALPPDPRSSVPLLPSSLSSPFAEEPSLTTLFKKHPSPTCLIVLFYLWHRPTNWICLFLSGFHPDLTLYPCHHRRCGKKARTLFTLFPAVSFLQHIGSVHYRRKKNLLCQSHAHHVISCVTTTLFGMDPKPYSYIDNFIL